MRPHIREWVVFRPPHPSLPPLSGSPAHSQRLVNVKSRLKQAPRYPALDRELVEYQERQLFEYFVVVSLHKKQAGAAYVPEVTQQFPLKVQRAGPASAACQGVTAGQGPGVGGSARGSWQCAGSRPRAGEMSQLQSR